MSALPSDLSANPLLSRWISVEDDGTLTIRTGKVELGQGSVTAIAPIAAAELRLPIGRLRVVAGDTGAAPDEGMTSSSHSIEQGGSAMRFAAAQTRELFIKAAARRLAVPAEEVRLEDGRFSAPPGNESLDYRDLREDTDLAVDPAELPLPSFIGLDGSAAPERLDLPAKLTGAAFMHDVERAGLCHGRVLRPPHPHARLAEFERAGVEELQGIVAVIVDGSFIGIVARREDEAEAALEKARRCASWKRIGELPVLDDENAWMEKVAPVSVAEIVSDELPTPAVAMRHEAVYSRPYIAHASLAPSCALAEWQDGRLTVWSHTQGVYPLRSQLAAALKSRRRRCM